MKKFLLLFLFMADQATNAEYVYGVTPAHLYNPTTGVLRGGETKDHGNLAGWRASRFQQLIGAADLVKVVPQGGWIDQISLLTEPGYDFFLDKEIKGFSISLGTTRSGPDSLSPIFAENLFAGIHQARKPEDTSMIRISQVKRQERGTGYRLLLPQPYFYDPNLGNLFIDFQQEGADLGVVFDFERSRDSAVGTVFGYGDTLPKGGDVFFGGFVMTLQMTPVPEPSTVGLAALGGAVLLAAAGARKDDQN